MNCKSLFEFDGQTFEPKHDRKRLSGQLGRVFSFMQDDRWHTLNEIQVECGGSTASVSARLRDLRKDWCGKHTVERRRVQDPYVPGLFEYHLIERK